MRLFTRHLRALIAAGALTIGGATTAPAAVLYSFEGTSVQGFVDAGRQAASYLTYTVKWTAIFDDFVTVGGFSSPSKPFSSCSITLDSFSNFSVVKKCGASVSLSHDTTNDGAAFTYFFPDYYSFGVQISGADPVKFAPGVLAQVGTFEGIYTGNLTGTGRITVKDLSAIDPEPPISPVPLPAGLPLLAGALGIFGVFARRRRT